MRRVTLWAKGFALLSLGDAHDATADLAKAITHYRQALTVAERVDQPALLAALWNNLGVTHMRAGHAVDAADCFVRTLRINQPGGAPHRNTLAMTLCNLAVASRAQGKLERSLELHRRAAAIHRESDDQRLEAIDLRGIGVTHHLLGQLDTALDHLRQAIDQHRSADDRAELARTQRHLATALLDAGGPAFETAKTALASAREIGDPALEAEISSTLGDICRRSDQPQQANEHYTRALHLAIRIGAGYTKAEALIGMGSVHLDLGEHGPARDCLRQAEEATRQGGLRVLHAEAIAALAKLSDVTG